MKGLLLIIGLLISALTTQAKNHSEHINNGYHIGAGAGVAWLSEKSGEYSNYHFHLLKSIRHSEKWQFGIGYETILGNEAHHVFNIPLVYSPIHQLSLKVGPGLLFTRENNKMEINFTTHIECIYEFEIGNIHLGPMIGFGADKHGTHIGMGVHLGLSI